MDLLDLLGSTMAPPGSGTAKALGAMMHLTNGVLLAIFWAYGVALVDLSATWWTALVWA